MALLSEVPRRYVEQIQTTVETMRRRVIALYDMSFRVGVRANALLEQTRETVEPMAYDARDFVVSAVNNNDPLDEKNRDLRNNLLEIYLGISVLCLGLSSGSLSGATLLSPILGILNPLLLFVALFALPGYLHYTFRRNPGIDDTERRVSLFGIAFFIGAVFGHFLGPRLLSTAPAVLFVLPVCLALCVDSEIAPKGFFVNRQQLLSYAGSGGAILAYVLSQVASGAAFTCLIAVTANAAFLFVHFQVTLAALKGTSLNATDLQFGYVVAVALLQAIIALILGDSQHGTRPPPPPQ